MERKKNCEKIGKFIKANEKTEKNKVQCKKKKKVEGKANKNTNNIKIE